MWLSSSYQERLCRLRYFPLFFFFFFLIMGYFYLYNCHVKKLCRLCLQNNWLSSSGFTRNGNNLHFLPFQAEHYEIHTSTGSRCELFGFTARGNSLVLMAILQTSHCASIKWSKTYSTALGGEGKLVETDLNHRLYLLKPRPRSI